MEEDLTDDESVVVQETRPPPQPRRTSGNGYLKFGAPPIPIKEIVNTCKKRNATKRHRNDSLKWRIAAVTGRIYSAWSVI
jgi:hypothetical protein